MKIKSGILVLAMVLVIGITGVIGSGFMIPSLAKDKSPVKTFTDGKAKREIIFVPGRYYV